MPSQLRIFVSSPSDVREERLRAQLVIAKLARDYRGYVEVTPYFWENEPLRASGHFQDEIEPPSRHDIVVLILWSRLGTPLPERTAVRAYTGIDGRTPVTGTEWEFEDALAAFQDRNAPDLLVYRRSGDPGTSLIDPALRSEQERQWQALQAFWARHFEDRGAFHAASARYDTLDAFDARLEIDLAKLIERHIRSRTQTEAAQFLHLKGAPYRGLSAYDFADAPVFYGRDGAAREGLVRLSAASAQGCAFLMVLGASGSGKSSLARAGLLPGLVAAKAVPGVGLWRRVMMRPGDAGADPVLALANALLAGDPCRGEGLPELGATGTWATSLANHLRAAAADASYPIRSSLQAIAEREQRAKTLLAHEEARLVLVVDQLEELFTRPDIAVADRALFGRILSGFARSGVVWVVATMRSDLWHLTAELPDLVALVEAGSRLDLLPPNGAEILEVIRRPALATGLVFEEEARVGLDAMLAETAASEPGALPLLSVVLEDLYRRDVIEGHARRLSVASYRALGGLTGAIATRAETVLRVLEAADREAAAALPALLRALVTASDSEAVTARPSPLAAFPDKSPARRLIESMLEPDVRLLTVEGDARSAIVRLAHEALIEHWPRAKAWIVSNRRDIETEALLRALMRSHHEAAATPDRQIWGNAGTLLTGLRLQQALDLHHRGLIAPDSALDRFVADSARAQKRTFNRWIAISALCAAIVGMVLFAGYQALGDWFGYYRDWQREAYRTDIRGNLISFSTTSGQFAQDGVADTSPFTSSLLTNINNKYMDIATVLSRTNYDLLRSTYRQASEFKSSLNSQIFLHDSPTNRRTYVLSIGIGDYDYLPKLKNPSNDARAFAATMRGMGYNVNLVVDGNQEVIKQQFESFLNIITSENEIKINRHRGLTIGEEEIPQNTIAILFYSGQGVEIQGSNYIISKDASIPKSSDILQESAGEMGFIDLSGLIAKLAERVAVSIVIVDSCRDNPFLARRSVR